MTELYLKAVNGVVSQREKRGSPGFENNLKVDPVQIALISLMC